MFSGGFVMYDWLAQANTVVCARLLKLLVGDRLRCVSCVRTPKLQHTFSVTFILWSSMATIMTI